MDASGHVPGREVFPSCGAEFGCSAAQTGCPCWCAGLDVPDHTLDHLAAVHRGCLCPGCLTAAARAS